MAQKKPGRNIRVSRRGSGLDGGEKKGDEKIKFAARGRHLLEGSGRSYVDRDLADDECGGHYRNGKSSAPRTPARNRQGELLQEAGRDVPVAEQVAQSQGLVSA